MAWEENSRICLHMQLIAILSRIGANRGTCVLHKYAADALTIHNENIHPLGVEKNIGSVVYFIVAGYTFLICIFVL